MFASTDIKIKERFLSDAAKYFNSGVENVDFVHKTKKAIRKINAYVSEKTNNKINNLIRKGKLSK